MFTDKIVVSKKSLIVAVSFGFLAVGTSVAIASGDAHHVDSGILLKDFLWRAFNFSLTVAILVYFVSKPLKNALASRREGIEQALKSASETAGAAEAKYAEYDKKLTHAESEIESIRSSIKEEAELEKKRIIAEAHDMAEKIKSEAQKTSDNEVAQARLTLQREAVTMAVSIAEDMLKKVVNKEDQSRLVEEYKLKVGELH
ncbi:MAG: ATP synthase F0 subunit B [Thermodesulfobacteriota bacterium]|nr:ATP synthase F0 subunit B [Thermodesulfobacteriota bacterium]